MLFDRGRVGPAYSVSASALPGAPLFYLTGKSMRPALDRLSSPSRKNILIFRNRKSVYIHGHPASQEGRFAVVTDVGAGCDGRSSTACNARTNGADADGEVVWS
jgi:uncharacterized Zn-binding protein involved in type VI secretion